MEHGEAERLRQHAFSKFVQVGGELVQDSFDPANAADHVALLSQHQVQAGM